MQPWPEDVREYVDSLDLGYESRDRLVSLMEWLRSLDEGTHPDDMGCWAGVRPDGGPDDDVYATVEDEGELAVRAPKDPCLSLRRTAAAAGRRRGLCWGLRWAVRHEATPRCRHTFCRR